MEFITKPFGWLLMLLYELVKNYGFAVILFALVVKVIMLPFQMKSKRSMMKTSRLQPKLKELEKKHGANKQKYNEEVAKLYKEEKINPMSGCLWSLIPFPIIIALFSAIRNPLTIMMGVPKALIEEGGAILEKLTSMGFSTTVNQNYLQIAQSQFISEHFDSFASLSDKLRQIDYSFLGMDLGQNPKFDFLWTTDWSDPSIWGPGLLLFLLPIVSGALAFLTSRISMKMNAQPDSQQANSMKSMMLFMPLINVYFAFIMPGAIGVYIIASMLFQTVQDIILTKHYTKILEAEDAVKLEQQRIREAELEAKRQETERRKLENNTQKNPNTSKKKQAKTERQEQLEKAAEWEKQHSPTPEAEQAVDPSREGHRRYARGRAYDPERFANETETADDSETGAEAEAEETTAEVITVEDVVTVDDTVTVDDVITVDETVTAEEMDNTDDPDNKKE